MFILDSYIYQANLEFRATLPDYLILLLQDIQHNNIYVCYTDFYECYKDEFDYIQEMSRIGNMQLDHHNLKILTAYLINKQYNDIEDDDMSVIENMNIYRKKKTSVNVIVRNIDYFNFTIADYEIKESDTTRKIPEVNEYVSLDENSKNKLSEEIMCILEKNKFFNISSDFNKPDIMYLLILIHNNNLIILKNLLSRKFNDQYIIPNDIIFQAANDIYYTYLKEQIFQNLNKNSINPDFFYQDNLLKILKTIMELFKICRKRNLTSYHTPFPTEKDIVNDNSSFINKLLEEIEKVILIIKIIRSYNNNIYLNDESRHKLILDKIHSYMENKNRYPFSFFELVMLNDYKEIYPFWKILFINFFINIKSDIYYEPEGDINFYFSKLQLFFYYYYVVSDLINLSYSINDVNTNIESYFVEMKEDYDEYADICYLLYKLDDADRSRNKIDMILLSKFLNYLNGQTFNYLLPKNMVNKLQVNNFHITFIGMLKNAGYITEAIELSKNMNYAQEDIYSHLDILLKLNLYHLAYQFVSYTFSSLVSPEEIITENITESIAKSKEYHNSKELYFTLFKTLIENNQIKFLLSIPFNFIENRILKDFLFINKEYEEILFLYNVSIKNVKESDSTYKKIPDIDTKPLYRNLLIDLKILFYEDCETESKYKKFDNVFKIDYNLNKINKRSKIISEIPKDMESSMLLGNII